MEDWESLARGLRQVGAEVTGTLRVTISAPFGGQHTSPLLPQFMVLHPNMHLGDQTIDMASEGFDLVIRIGVLVDSSPVVRRIAANCRVVCASPDYLCRRDIPRTPVELTAHDCLLMFDSHGCQDVWYFNNVQNSQGGGRPTIAIFRFAVRVIEVPSWLPRA